MMSYPICPLLLDELEVVVVIRQLQAGLADLGADDVQALGDHLELLDGPRLFVQPGPRDVLVPERAGALDASIDVTRQVVDRSGHELVQVVVAARGRQVVVRQQRPEGLGVHPVVADAGVVKAVGLDFLVAQCGNARERARDVLPHGGTQCEQLQAHLEGAGLSSRDAERRGGHEGRLVQESSSGDHSLPLGITGPSRV